MRGFSLGLSLSIAFILGCVSAPLIVPPLSAQQVAQGVQRWEYACRPTSMETMPAIDLAVTQFNTLGAEGWELVFAAPRSVVACFKRPL